jgi:hypothetical protein
VKRKVAEKEAPNSLAQVAAGVAAGGLVGAVVGKAVGRTNGSAVKWATIGAVTGGALAWPSPSADMAQVVDYLQENLGRRTTAYLSGVDDTAMVESWSHGTPPLEDAVRNRLWSAYQATQCLVDAYDPQTARAWFLGMNPTFNDEAPARILRHSRDSDIWGDVVLAAREFAET